MAAMQENRYIPVHADAFAHPLPHFAERLAGRGPIRIVALGSSSTEGEGNVVPYPFRLQGQLREKYPGRVISVLNRGISGQEAPAELARMKKDVIGEHPALVIWQVGTNAVWQLGHNLDDVTAAIAEGLTLLAGQPADVVLMDLQYVPAVLTPDKIGATRRMLAEITAAAAARPGVNVFHRFTMMKKWRVFEKFSFDTLVNPADYRRLHQSDYSTQRIAWELCEAIAAAARAP
jgi:lysophospholipase L1-like esterase